MPLPEAKQHSPQTLEQWTDVLCDQEMPIFSNTAQNIYQSLDDKVKGAMELASIILKDPNLTTKLLKVSNSVYYNPSNQKMSTVSRAIVILGFNVIRELTIACSFFESIISPENKQRANEEIAQAIHAAVQAKEIAIACNDPSPEEVFVAALLNNIGQIAFWCFGGKQCQYILQRVQSGQVSLPDAEHEILGFNLSDLSKRLSKSWKLGGLIEDAINHTSDNPRIQSVQLGHEIAEAINNGWDSEPMQACLEKLSSLTEKEPLAIKNKLKKNTQSAVNIAHKFGANDASIYISPDSKTVAPPMVTEETVDTKQIQFTILQDITRHISCSIDLNHLLEMVIEGIHRGIGMDRTLFCLLSPDKKRLTEKLSLGWLKKLNTGKITLELSQYPENLFHKAMRSIDGIWATPESNSILYTPHVVNSIGKTECFLVPLYRETNPIGLIYADRSVSEKPFSEDDFISAKQFVQQAIIGLTLYKIKHTG